MQSGIICVDKPKDFTSFDVVAKARGITGCRKMGHGGTLDPMATGVLPLFLGRATKVMDIMPGEDKRYTA
ncbi:MAG: tRNA pseudouridine(55) synthase TruB, partial [Angelakisella sp.]